VSVLTIWFFSSSGFGEVVVVSFASPGDMLGLGDAAGFCTSSRAMERAVSAPSLAGMTPSTSFTLFALLWGAVAMPPFAGSPSVSRLDFHCLYLVNGNWSLTSSIVISFFSLLLLCGRGIAAKSIGSPFSPAAAAARRRLYLKQYFTPTMIHRFVKTTPNPKATKNSNGELVGPPPLPLFALLTTGFPVLLGAAEETGVDMVQACVLREHMLI
jgi:hypothetical protein